MRSTLSTFTADAAAAVPGPEWLRARRIAAATRFVEGGIPTSQEEVWRYSRIDELELDDFALAAPAAEPGGPSGDPFGDLVAIAPAIVVDVLDGVLVGATGSVDGVTVATLADHPDAEALLGSVAADGSEPFVDLNLAFAPDAVIISVRRGLVVPAPILVAHRVTAEGAAVFPRVIVHLADGAQAVVVERYASDDVHALVVPVVELRAERAARLTYVAVQELGPRVWQLGNQVSSVAQEATVLAGSITLGGDYARLRTDCRLEGRGASGDLLAAYFGEGSQALDFRTFQDHRAPDGTSNLLFKGAVGDHSRSVYTGLIRVRKEASGTNAFQTNRNIKLSEHAWAESVPNLEIENNDVSCSHASTVGPIDDEQRFYLESRGVPPHVAERLVVAGFFDEVIERIDVPGLAEPIRRRIGVKLDRAHVGEAVDAS